MDSVTLLGPSSNQCSTALVHLTGLARKLFRGVPAISGFDWPFTPTHISSRGFSTPLGTDLHGGLIPLHPGHG